MNRGPAPNSRPAVPFSAKVKETWPTPTPEWIVELAALADREGLAGAEAAIGYSRSAISTVLANKYRGDVDSVEQKVRGALMAETVECPVLGPIGRDRCLDEQKEPFRATSAFRARLFQACRNGCPNARRKDGDK